jgi:hypothetical protein
MDSDGDNIADTILAVQGPGGTTNQIREFAITSTSPLQVAPATTVPGSYPGPLYIAAVTGALPSLAPIVPFVAPTSVLSLPAKNVKPAKEPKVEKVKEPKAEKVKAPKLEKVKAPKVEKVKAPKVEKVKKVKAPKASAAKKAEAVELVFASIGG